MTEKPPERVGSVSLQLLQPRYGDRSRPFFRRDKPTEASKQWLDTKVNFLNEMMKFIPRNMADALSSHSYSKESVKNIDKSNLRAESAYNAQFIKDSGDLWKGTQSVTASNLFGDNLSSFTGMLGTPYDGQIGAGAKIIGTDGTEEIRPVFVSATDQEGNDAYGLYYKDEKGKRWPVGSAPIVPMPKAIQGEEFGRYFGEGVDFHPTVVDMRHTLLKSQVDINGDGVGETDLTTTALTTTDYADKYLRDMGVFSPVLDYSESFKNFMSGSELGSYVKPTAYTYNKLGSQGSGDFSGLLEKIKLKSGVVGYVPNIYELARSGFDVGTLSDKEVLQLSMLMLESRRRFTYGMSTVFGTKKDQVDMVGLVGKYANPSIWNGNDGQFYTTVTTSTGKTEKVYNYFIPEGKDLSFLNERAAEVQTWRAAKDLYIIGMQSGACNNPELNLLKDSDSTVSGGITEIIKLRTEIKALTNNELQPKLIHVLMQKLSEVKDALVLPSVFSGLAKTPTEDNIDLITLTSSMSSDVYNKYKMYNLLKVAEAKIMKGAGDFLKDNSEVTSVTAGGGTSTESLMDLYLRTRYPDTFGMSGVSGQTRDVVRTLATMGYEDVDLLKTKLADPSAGILELLPDGTPQKKAGDLLLTLLEQSVEKKMRIFHDLSSTDEFNRLMYGVIPGTEIGYMPASIAKSTASSPFLSKSKKLSGSADTLTSMSSVTDRMYFAMTEKMQKMADFYMMSMFASPHEGDENDLNFLRSLKDGYDNRANITNAVGMMDSTLKEMMTATDANGDGHLLTANTSKVFGILKDSLTTDYEKEKVFLTSLHNRLKTIVFNGSVATIDNRMGTGMGLGPQDWTYYFPTSITNTVDFNNKINELKSWLTTVAASPSNAFNVNVSETNLGPLHVNRAAAILGLINNGNLAGSVTQAASLTTAASSVTNSTSGILLYETLLNATNLMNSFKAPGASVDDLITISTDPVALSTIQTSNMAITNLLNNKWKMAAPPAASTPPDPKYAQFYELTSETSIATNVLKDYLKNLASQEDVLNTASPDFKSLFKEIDAAGAAIPDAVLFNKYIRSVIRDNISPDHKIYDALSLDTNKLLGAFTDSLKKAVNGFVLDATTTPPTLDKGLINENGTRSVSIDHLQTCEGLFKELSPKPVPARSLSQTITSTLTDSRTSLKFDKRLNVDSTTYIRDVWHQKTAATPTASATGYWETVTTAYSFKEVGVTGQQITSALNTKTGRQTYSFTDGTNYHFERVEGATTTTPDPGVYIAFPGGSTTINEFPARTVVTPTVQSLRTPDTITSTLSVPLTESPALIDGNGDYYHTLDWPLGSLGRAGIPINTSTTPPTPAIPPVGPTTVTIGSHADNRIAITRTGTNLTASLSLSSNATTTNFINNDKFVNRWAYGRLFCPNATNVADSYAADPFDSARTFDTNDPTMSYDPADPSAVRYYGVNYYNNPTSSGQTKYVSMMDDFCRDFVGIQPGKNYTTKADQRKNINKLMTGLDSFSVAFRAAHPGLDVELGMQLGGDYSTEAQLTTNFNKLMTVLDPLMTGFDPFSVAFRSAHPGINLTTYLALQDHLYQKLMTGTDATSVAFRKKWKDQGKPDLPDLTHPDYAPSTYDILMVSKTDLVEFNQMTTALTGQYQKIRQQVNDILSISTLSNVKDLYFNEFYMKGTFQSLIMTSEYKGRYIDGVANTDMMGEARRSGWYESDGQLYSSSREDTSMDFNGFDYNVDTDLVNLKQDVQTDRTVSTLNNDNIRSKRKRSILDYFQTITASGTTVSGTLRSDSTALNKNTMRVGKVSALVHADIELSSTYQEVLMANMITGMYNDNTKHDEKIQADRDKEQLELYNQEQAEIERSNAVAEANARAARAAWSIRRKR